MNQKNMDDKRKLAVIFPGIGYHYDKPLLFYSKKIAKNAGYEVIDVPYQIAPANIKGDSEKMQQSFLSALDQTRDQLKNIDFESYETILFISKSIGTCVASAYAKEKELHTYHVFYTPVEASFSYMEPNGIVFHGTKDPLVETELVKRECDRIGLPLYITEEGNHSLETGDVFKDLNQLREIMIQTDTYIRSIV